MLIEGDTDSVVGNIGLNTVISQQLFIPLGIRDITDDGVWELAHNNQARTDIAGTQGGHQNTATEVNVASFSDSGRFPMVVRIIFLDECIVPFPDDFPSDAVNNHSANRASTFSKALAQATPRAA